MGNCMETYTTRQQDHAGEKKEQHQHDDNKGKNNGLSMKVVLTKEELKWLILQLNEKRGMRVEEMLAQIERGREKVGGWKPSLESILEAPEMLEMDITT